MMRLKILSISICFILVGNIVIAQEGQFKSSSEPDGFRGIKWGTDKSQFSDLYWETDPTDDYGVWDDDPLTNPRACLLKKNENLVWEGVKLWQIEYEFNQNKFSGVVLVAAGSEGKNAKVLKEAAIRKFGMDYRIIDDEKYEWSGRITKAKLFYWDAIYRCRLRLESLEN